MKALFVFCTLFFAQLLFSAQAQQPALQTPAAQEHTGYSFAVVVASKVLTTQGDWKQSTRLSEYAMTKPGTYIVFATGTGLSLLTNASAVSKTISLYREVARLDDEQKSLEAKQAPLTKQQEALAAQMRKAPSPSEMRRIGAEQGRIGLEQAAIGQNQGQVGEKQGIAGRKFYNAVQAVLDACVANRSCLALRACSWIGAGLNDVREERLRQTRFRKMSRQQ